MTGKIVLADDERMIRLAMESMLEELYPGRFRFIHVDNGECLVSLLEAQHPDIIFVDIRMPRMDGLEAMSRCRSLCPEAQWIIVTGYADFAYAQRALKLGAREYLLKPVSSQDLAHLMEELYDDDKERRKKKNDQFSMHMMLAFHELQTIENTVVKSESGKYRVYLIYADHGPCSGQAESNHDIYTGVTDYLQAMPDKEFLYSLFFLLSGELCLVTLGETDGALLADSDALNSFPSPVTVLYAEANDLQHLYTECCKLQALSVMRIVTRFGQCSDITDLNGDPGLLKLAALLESISLACMEKDGIAFNEGLGKLASGGELQDAFGRAEPRSAEAYFRCCCGHVDAADCQSFIRDLYALRDSVFTAKGPAPAEVAADIQQYVECHYMEQIGINTLAERYNKTPNYLSMLFHSETGVKFIDYLTDVRISNAKKLLQCHPEYTVRKVAESVGYLSTRYFTKTFYKKVGKLPSEYNNVLGRSG